MPDAFGSGVQIRYDDLGQGEPAYLCLSGWCADRSHFQGVAARLARRRRVLCLDWRGHGDSAPAPSDFGVPELVEDALAVIAASGARAVVPVATSHAGWVAIALRARLGDRIPQLVFVDWLVLDVPPSFRETLAGMRDPARCRAALDALFARWTPPGSPPAVTDYVHRVMAATPDVMWARAARAIEVAYARTGSPLEALARLTPPPPTLHVYAIPKDDGFLAAQTAFAAKHPWFIVERLTSRTHFPTIDAPDALAEAVERFTVGRCAPSPPPRSSTT